MVSMGSVSTFAVPDRRHPTKSRVLFARPIEFQGHKFVGLFDEVSDIPDGMTYDSWGYLVADSVLGTANAIKLLVWESSRPRSCRLFDPGQRHGSIAS
jgi:hypothetical protein